MHRCLKTMLQSGLQCKRRDASKEDIGEGDEPAAAKDCGWATNSRAGAGEQIPNQFYSQKNTYNCLLHRMQETSRCS